jgi:hypothetical protein
VLFTAESTVNRKGWPDWIGGKTDVSHDLEKKILALLQKHCLHAAHEREKPWR